MRGSKLHQVYLGRNKLIDACKHELMSFKLFDYYLNRKEGYDLDVKATFLTMISMIYIHLDVKSFLLN